MAGSRSVVFVLAMSRSGTSAITRILSLARMSLPADLMEPNIGNPTGYWESNEVVALNDAFLESLGSSYYDPTVFAQADRAPFDSQEARAFVASIGNFIASHGDDVPLLIKDPRLVGLAPHWFRGAARAGRTVHCILPVRDPHAVIASLKARDGASFAFSNVLWLKYTLLAERVSRRFLRVFVDYEAMIDDWGFQLKRIEREIGLAHKRKMKTAVRAFVDPQLDHRNRRAGDRARALLPLTDVVFEQISRAARDEPIDTGILDRAFTTFCDRESKMATGFARSKDLAFAFPGDEIAKWDALGLRFARELAKGTPFPSA